MSVAAAIQAFQSGEASSSVASSASISSPGQSRVKDTMKVFDKKDSGGASAEYTVDIPDMQILMIVESQEGRAAVFEEDSFQNCPNVSVDIDLLAPIRRKECDCFIIPCESSAGPSYPKWGLAGDIVKQIGGDLQERVDNYIVENYMGYAPPGSCFILKANEDMYALIVILCPLAEFFNQPGFVYNAFRSSLLEIRKHNIQLKNGKLPAGSTNIKRVACPLFPSIEKISVTEVVWQMAHAYRSCCIPKPDQLDPPSLIERQRAMLNAPKQDEATRQQRFKNIVMQDQVSKRGLFCLEEVNWLLTWISDPSQVKLQESAAKALAEYIRIDKQRLPTDISKAQIIEIVLGGDRVHLRNLMTLAEAGTINIHNEIDPNELELGDLLGTGATATVRKANYRGIAVAYKEFHEGVDMREFNKEVALMSLLQHPCLVRIFGAGIKDRTKPFIVSELVERGALYDLLFPEDEKKKKDISLDQVLVWAQDTAAGMHYLHSVGILHRDLKSLNLLITDDYHCKITDYGASRFIDKNANMTGNVGTAAWMAPEVFTSPNYTEKADVYSFAICIYEMVTRLHPFADTPSYSIPVLVTKGGRPTIPKTVPKDWAKLIKECWHEKPAKRPTFFKLMKQLEQWKR